MGDFEDIYAESGTHDDAGDFLGGDEKSSAAGGAKDDDIFGAIGGTEDGDAGVGGGGGGGGIGGNDDDDDDDDDGVEISFSEAPSGNNSRSSAPTQVRGQKPRTAQCLLPPAIRLQAVAL
jgi:DnaJ-class molecular chaperone